MIKTNILLAFFLFFIQPLFIIGLIYAIINRNRRVNYSRKTFRVNFIRKNFEPIDFLFKGILLGILLSIVSVAIGTPLTIEWYLIYQGIAIFLLIIGGSRFIHPMITFPLSAISLYIMEWLPYNFTFLKKIPKPQFLTSNIENFYLPSLNRNLLFFSALILFATIFWIKEKDSNKLYPLLKASQRGKKLVKYQNKKLTVLPLLIIVPGEALGPLTKWWPLLNIGGERFAILFLPVLLGLHYTLSTQLLKDASERLSKDLQVLTLTYFVLFAVSYFYPGLSLYLSGIALVGSLFVLYRHHRRERMWSFKYGPADEGLRVIAVRPDSPAERMDLAIGDIIMNIHQRKMTDKAVFNEAISDNRSYIKMRVLRNDGEIVIAETPLYDDDYNNLGVLVLDQ